MRRHLLASLALAATALALASLPALAAPKRAAAPAPTDTLRLTLDDAVHRALGNGPEARVAQAAVGIADGQVRTAFAQALPQVTGSLTYDRRFASIYQNLSADPTLGPLFANSAFAAVHNWTADLTASQTVWASGRVGAGLAAARAVRNATTATRDEALADITLNVRTAYFEAAYARDVQVIAEEGLAQSREHLKQVQLFRTQGSRSEYDLLQAQVDAANQEPAAVAARNNADQALLQLRRLMNVPLTQPLVLSSPLGFEGGSVPVLEDAAVDGAGRPVLRSSQDMVVARRQALRAERATRWPTVVASATVSQQAYPTNMMPSRRDFARAIDGSLRLEWPLFQGFRTFGTVQRASAELRQAEAERDRTIQGVELEVEAARQNAQEALAALAARRGTAALAQRAHYLAGVRWKNGLSTQLEVSDARLQMQTAEVNEVAATKDYRLALLRLERATGHPLRLTTRPIDELSPTQTNDGANR
jgi:outer membrane protein